jgi:peptide/nickel transport system substrate-binding protein
MHHPKLNRRAFVRYSAGAATAVAAGRLAIGGRTSAQNATPVEGPVGGTLAMAIATEPVGLDPCNPWNLGSGLYGMLNLPYDDWLVYGRDFKLRPYLASSWERTAPDTVVFEIHKGATFHQSGRELTAADVAKTVERFTNKDLACGGSDIFASQVAALTPLDTYRFEVKLKTPNLLVQRINLPLIPDPDYVAQNANPLLLQAEAGTGPWILEKWEPQTAITFKRNPNYWGGAPLLEEFRFQIIPDETTAIAALKTGQINYLPISSYDNYEQVKDDPDLNTWANPGYQYLRLNVNHLRPALQDPNVLQALRYGINRQQLVDTLSHGLGVVSGPLSPANQFYALPADETAELEKYDPEQAKSLLAKAGYDTENKRLRLVCLSIADFSNFTDVAQVVAANLADIGIDLEIRIQEIGVWVDSRTKTKDYDLSANDHSSGGLDPDYTYYRSDQAEQDWTGGGDPELDKLIDASNVAEDENQRRDAIQQIQRRLIENVREIYLYAPPVMEAASKQLVGYQPFPGSIELRVFVWDHVSFQS